MNIFTYKIFIMTEKEFEKSLLDLINQLLSKKITPEEFHIHGRALSDEMDKTKLWLDFKDEDLGWAKYCIEEMSYYGPDHVINKMFDFEKFYNSRKSK
ncbi:hypothetical protein KC678_02100 [Candidatus Dojkabacteria bacterium]|uniref:Uncharacterized protein n=1 Tax=Candidatus Dojkabacteria bacterium TaxID=2099670 RepID=A0A955L0H5_9BACT|nr:hypothetical protein [Candidatus Dojkabacteria bacterium]